MDKPLVCEDGEHCDPECPFLKDRGATDAICSDTGNELYWHDFWMADCINMDEP